MRGRRGCRPRWWVWGGSKAPHVGLSASVSANAPLNTVDSTKLRTQLSHSVYAPLQCISVLRRWSGSTLPGRWCRLPGPVRRLEHVTLADAAVVGMSSMPLLGQGAEPRSSVDLQSETRFDTHVQVSEDGAEQRNLLPDTRESPRGDAWSTLLGSLERFNGRMYGALLAKSALPTVYTTVRVFYLGDMPADTGVNIAAQLAWVNVILEVFHDALIVPLYYCIRQTLTNHNENETSVRVRSGLAVTFALYMGLGVAIAAGAPELVEWMAQNTGTHAQTVVYIRLEMLSVLMKSLVDFLSVTFLSLDMHRPIWILLLIQLIATITCDTIFLSSLPISMQLGVNGIAFSNWISLGASLSYGMYVTWQYFGWSFSDWFSWPRPGELRWLRDWFQVGKYSALDSLVRNAFYVLFILRMMNVIEEAGTYWLANTFIWSWLLLPITPLADLLKRDAAGTPIDHWSKTSAYYAFSLAVCGLWLVTMPVWPFFMTAVLNVPADNVSSVLSLVYTLVPFCTSFFLLDYQSDFAIDLSLHNVITE
eukprot:COSAG02_NODE_736_length_17865_cov_9.190420_8_plen_534_part_00